MADTRAPASAGRRELARHLAEQAIESERVGDQQTADERIAEAQRIDPDAVIDVLQEHENDRPRERRKAVPAHAFNIILQVNGTDHSLSVDARTTLLDALRDRLHLNGTKRGCDLGQCGACTVLLDGKRINACLTLAVMAQGKAVTTIEGIAENGELHPMQQAFIDQDAFQCGYCTPGQIMSAIGLINEGRAKDDAAIREHMSGNICRCGAYTNIVAAVRDVAKEDA